LALKPRSLPNRFGMIAG
jgi:uncharacterized protein YegP (UPF0339 family)